MTHRDLVGADLYELVREALVAAFPDTGARSDDAVVDRTIEELLVDSSIEDLRAAFGAPSHAAARATSAAAEGVASASPALRYYRLTARHERLDHPLHRFVGHLAAVRFTLPESGRAAIETDIGRCVPDDRRLASRDAVRDHLRGTSAFADGHIALPERVELVTAPRTAHGRFAAIAAYLCYLSGSDRAPAYYVLEAGMATGEAKTLYVARNLVDPVLETISYQPTPFTNPAWWYHGHLEIDAQGELRSLKVQARKEKNGPPHLRVWVQYSQTPSTSAWYEPLKLQIEAGARVARIARMRGQGDGLGGLGGLLALGSPMLAWEKEPVPGPGVGAAAGLEAAPSELRTIDRARVEALVATAPQPGDDAWSELIEIAASHPDLVIEVVGGEAAPAEEELASGELEAVSAGRARNWAMQPVEPSPAGQTQPVDREEVVEAVRLAMAAGHSVRAIGRAYSDGGALGTSGIQISMRRVALSDGSLVRLYPSEGLTPTAHPRARHLVEVAAGARVQDVNEWLDRHGLALPMIGAFSGQTLIGAMQTSTHGTGLSHAPLCDLVRSMAIVVAGASGPETWRIERPDDPITDATTSSIPVRGRTAAEASWLDALGVSFGSMGAITSVVVEAVEAFRLRQTRYAQRWSWVRSFLRSHADPKHPISNPRFHGFGVLVNPYTEGSHGSQECVITELTRIVGPVPPDILQKRVSAGAPPHDPGLSAALVQLCIPHKQVIDERVRDFAVQPPPMGERRSGWNASWRVLAGANDYPYGISSEYAFPLETFVDALDRILVGLRGLYEQDQCVVGPVSVRFVGGSRSMLGLSEGGPRATVEILAALGAGGRPLFRCDDALDAIEEIALAGELHGRPHWGQRYRASWDTVASRYPRANEWLAVRRALDPRRVFVATHLPHD